MSIHLNPSIQTATRFFPERTLTDLPPEILLRICSFEGRFNARLRQLKDSSLELNRLEISNPEIKEKLFSVLFQSKLAGPNAWDRYYTLAKLKKNLANTELKNISQHIFKLGDVEEQARIVKQTNRLFCALLAILTVGMVLGAIFLSVPISAGIYGIGIPFLYFACYGRLPMDPIGFSKLNGIGLFDCFSL